MNQRRFIKAVAEGKSEFYSRDFLMRYGFEKPSTVQAALKALLEKELLIRENGRYIIENPLFEPWIRRVTSGK
ncbi:hypothetical protein [Pyrococcus sp. ST04]|uniref:hypothetical protein n=1 Tax=Pyrococcus sp. ST04 TaxID=1183377 RepID=UPI0006940C81|nr:hypothetical protein [Pyrococcus sp. ST04]